MAQSRKPFPVDRWTSSQAYTLAVVCFIIGIAGGWFIRGSQAPDAPREAVAAESTSGNSGVPGQPTPEQLRRMADKQAEGLLAQLATDPATPISWLISATCITMLSSFLPRSSTTNNL